MKEKDGELCWDFDALFTEIKAGLKKCKEIGKIPVSVGIDTWGVDFVLLDENEKVLGNTVGYRDSRTNGMDEEVYKIIPEDKLYARTGIQKAIFNTIYQLMAVKKSHPEYLEKAKTFLMVPDYFHYLLSGVKSNEYTEATTGQLIDPATKEWDLELIEMLGYPKDIFQPVKTPGTVLGDLTPEVQAEVGFNCKVVLPATHDTGSAVLAVPSNNPDTVYISSGTWSLMGVERMEADCSPKSKAHNFTNEGGYQYRFRYLKNIMGLWMIQSVKKELKEERGLDLSFAVICEEASKQEIQEMTGKKYDSISIVGGGANAEYLNELTAKYTGRTVFAGPTEATAIGNLMVQMMTNGELKDLASARDCVFDSFAVKTYKPEA